MVGPFGGLDSNIPISQINQKGWFCLDGKRLMGESTTYYKACTLPNEYCVCDRCVSDTNTYIILAWHVLATRKPYLILIE